MSLKTKKKQFDLYFGEGLGWWVSLCLSLSNRRKKSFKNNPPIFRHCILSHRSCELSFIRFYHITREITQQLPKERSSWEAIPTKIYYRKCGCSLCHYNHYSSLPLNLQFSHSSLYLLCACAFPWMCAAAGGFMTQWHLGKNVEGIYWS